ncbi:MAG: DUF429 domain-containing protein [Gemmatimonadetes bacterium]|nr:DUF429 domain-containing protein [Gemmatimonadota bacterium]
MTAAFVGIDVAFRKKKRLPISVCTWQGGRLVPLMLKRAGPPFPPVGEGNRALLKPGTADAFALAVLGYLRDVESAMGVRIHRVAIDAPSAPRREGIRRRMAELAMDRLRISCIGTPSRSDFEEILHRGREHLRHGGAESRLPHANQLWMLAGFALFSHLGAEFECIEVFPQATAVALGVAAVHKRRSEGYSAQLAAVARETRWPEHPRPSSLDMIGFGSRDDKLDAYLSAWVASLPEEERIACGEPPDDVIWLPKTHRSIQH